ncbi:hypothetical protein T07_10282 [Trichinella nelsoni]|uniref:Uncharacterized protein n=1 Tax=Trichinella nelsoni TaxID=6336 RepID=A0A0V0RB43_9BILA|nr:hypothetical protein T07_10282 [Trichinella nelsoni]
MSKKNSIPKFNHPEAIYSIRTRLFAVELSKRY